MKPATSKILTVASTQSGTEFKDDFPKVFLAVRLFLKHVTEVTVPDQEAFDIIHDSDSHVFFSKIHSILEG